MSGPLSAVLAQVEAGTPTVSEIARVTGLSEEVARAAVDHLLRSGRLSAGQVPLGCPPGGCGGCSVAASCSQPVMLTLSVRR
jgi:hypothetical protein